MQPDDTDIRELAATGRLIEAIRLYRERHGVGLAEARDAVERLRSGEAPASSAPPVERTALDPALLAEIDALLRAGKRIPAIKLLRERLPSTLGLKEAKDEIDRRAAELGLPAASRCFIATAAYGDPNAPEVLALRHFRDRVLRRSPAGRRLIELYERLSPPLAARLARSDRARALVRRLLTAVSLTLHVSASIMSGEEQGDMSSDLGPAKRGGEPAVRSIIDTRKEEILQRYQQLVDQKYLRGLTEAEQCEMDELGQEIDGFYDDFYAPLLADLEQRLKNRASDRSG